MLVLVPQVSNCRADNRRPNRSSLPQLLSGVKRASYIHMNDYCIVSRLPCQRKMETIVLLVSMLLQLMRLFKGL
jgi:hypothetical protein